MSPPPPRKRPLLERTCHILKPLLKRYKQEFEAINNYYLSNCRHNTYYKDFVDDKITFSTAKSLQRRDWNQKHIFQIQKNDGTKTSEPNEILAVIKQQYDELFKSEGICLQNLQQFLAINNFPKLNNEQKVNLDVPFTEEEVKESIHALQGNKTPGFDSIPIEFYWKFSDLISKILFFYFQQLLATRQNVRLGLYRDYFSHVQGGW